MAMRREISYPPRPCQAPPTPILSTHENRMHGNQKSRAYAPSSDPSVPGGMVKVEFCAAARPSRVAVNNRVEDIMMERCEDGKKARGEKLQ